MNGGREFAGTLRERVTIARQVDGADVLGAAGEVWEIVATCWAAVMADGVGEAVAGEATSAAARFTMTLRDGVAVTPGDRIGWAGRTLRVRAVMREPTSPDRIGLRVEELR